MFYLKVFNYLNDVDLKGYLTLKFVPGEQWGDYFHICFESKVVYVQWTSEQFILMRYKMR